MSTLIEALVDQYIAACPTYTFPPSGERHPAVLAIGTEMQNWLMAKLGGPSPYWQAMLDSAKVWFPPGTDSREFRIYCNLFEAAGNVGGNGHPDYDAIARQYHEWRKTLKQS